MTISLARPGRRAGLTAALILAPQLVAGAAHGGDVTGRIEGPAINRPGVALPQESNAAPVQAPADNSVELNFGDGSQQQVQVTKQPSIYQNPVRGYAMPIPAGVVVGHRGEEKNVAIRALNGYVINLQTGDRSADTSLEGMLARLESRYLGDQGPWQRKQRQETFKLAGMPAIDATYQGLRTTSRIVIARGAKTDFVFSFGAPGDLYVEHSPVFEWVVAHFRPGPGEVAAPAPVAAAPEMKTPPSAPVRAASTVAPQAAGRPASGPSATPPDNMHRFTEPGYGFIMDYPKDWVVEKPTAFTASFSGPQGTPAHEAVISVQNVHPSGAKSGPESATIAAADLLKALDQGTRGMKVLGEGALAESPGSQFVARYEFSGRSYRKWAVVVPRPEGTIAHIWSFTAPDRDFEAYRPVAESMLRSWTLTQ